MFADKLELTMSETMLVAVAGIIVVLLELAILAILIVFLSKIYILSWVLKRKLYFSIDFTKKKIISCIFGFYNMFVKSKGYWPIFKKI